MKEVNCNLMIQDIQRKDVAKRQNERNMENSLKNTLREKRLREKYLGGVKVRIKRK